MYSCRRKECEGFNIGLMAIFFDRELKTGDRI